MKDFIPKVCGNCGELFTPTGYCQKYCAECRRAVDLQRMRDRHKRTYQRKGYNQSGENNNNYKNGIGMYKKSLNKYECELCGSKKNLLIHHKDEDRTNNDLENLAVWCKKCHQEHHCVRDDTGRYSQHTPKGIV